MSTPSIRQNPVGICSQCSRPSKPGYRSCEIHVEKRRKDMATKRVKRKAAGLCIGCGRNPPASGVRCRDCHETQRASIVKSQYRAKCEAIVHYGGKCQCCGEDRICFLTIDHIDGGGNVHRQEVGSGHEFHRWLKKNGYPDGFQVLCYNCNCGKHDAGECPHKSGKLLMTAEDFLAANADRRPRTPVCSPVTA